MAVSYEFTLPTVTPSLNVWQRMHPMQRPKVRQAFGWQCRAKKPPHWPRPAPRHVRVTIVRHGKKALDQDNLVGGCKPLVDALKDAGYIDDDSPARLELHVSQQRVPFAGEPYTEIRLEVL